MAIGWLTVLQSVPWTDVVRNAPKLAAGAKQLWNNAAIAPVADRGPVDPAMSAQGGQVTQVLQAQLAELQKTSSAQQDQLRESAELIRALAEQNTQLVERVNSLHKRILLIMVVVSCVAAGTVLAVALALN
jgi:hypothetical protein